MKPTPFALAASLLSLVPASVGRPVGIPTCPIYEFVLGPNPFQSTALPNYYLSSTRPLTLLKSTMTKDGVAVLVNYQSQSLEEYSSNGPLGIWGVGPTIDGCPGFSYLNAHQQTATYATLTWDAVSITNWNATVGKPLAKIGSSGAASFLACKRPSTTTKTGTYVLILQAPDTTLPDSFSSGDGDVLTRVSCTPTKILVTPVGPNMA
ncbi:hypothetical protein M407DRAFT_5484 [Tulasnella calospora MUT 4182]|uniref:Uncharacterized protein n=1 Tax=Tulasnella calospora MUT 4182 TaxID=1051891 RepID=A0A0C3QS36_9AGAM|nr:hypothetical protein M407DRAFT_5484 [Tulasnella calospora MUT 4182]